MGFPKHSRNIPKYLRNISETYFEVALGAVVVALALVTSAVATVTSMVRSGHPNTQQPWQVSRLCVERSALVRRVGTFVSCKVFASRDSADNFYLHSTGCCLQKKTF